MDDERQQGDLGFNTLALGVSALHKELKKRFPKGIYTIGQRSLFGAINLAARVMPQNVAGTLLYPHSITNVEYEFALASEACATATIRGELIDPQEAYGRIEIEVVIWPFASREPVKAVRTQGDDSLFHWIDRRSRRSAARLSARHAASPMRGGGWERKR